MVTIGYILQTYIVNTYVYDTELTIPMVVEKALYAAGVFTIVSTHATALLHFSKLHQGLSTVNESNIKLLDSMSQGVLVLSQENKQAIFCNTAAQTVLSRAVRQQSNASE